MRRRATLGALLALAFCAATHASYVSHNHHKNAPSHHCTSLEDATSLCVYKQSLCYSQRHGVVILVDDPALDGHDVVKDDTLPPAPFYVGWNTPNADTRGPPHWQPASLPYRSFIPGTVRFQHGASFLATHNVSRVAGWTALLAFDADNYNIYHWVNTVYAAFLGRLKFIERVGMRSFNAAHTMDRLMRGQGYNQVIALRGPPTDWQQNYADIVLGVKDAHTKYVYLADRAADDDDDAYQCFDRAIIPGASLCLSSSVTNAHLVRQMAAAVKHVPYPSPQDMRRSFAVTWFVRPDRAIINLDQALATTRRAIARFETSRGVDVSLDIVHWSEHDPFTVQASQMARTRVLISTHGSALNHAIFMPTGGVVIEVNAYQFRHALDDLSLLLQGHHYTRFSAAMSDTRHRDHPVGHDPFPDKGGGECNQTPGCALSRRDASLIVDLARWKELVEQSLDAVV